MPITQPLVPGIWATGALSITLLTVSFQAIEAALSNAIKVWEQSNESLKLIADC